MVVVRGAIPGPKGGLVTIRTTKKTVKEKQAATAVSLNPQKASARINPQKASARNK
jgi:large subunit ribosomal protein L3